MMPMAAEAMINFTNTRLMDKVSTSSDAVGSPGFIAAKSAEFG